MTTDLSFLSTKEAGVSHDSGKIYKDGGLYYTYETYSIAQKYGMSTREISLYRDSIDNQWRGDIIAFGESWTLDQEDVDYVLKFLEEFGGEHF